jgi:hypothetical protein
LRSSQRRRDRRRVGTARHARAAAREARRGASFDRVMEPGRRLVAVRQELDQVSNELDAVRSARFGAARRTRGLEGRPERVHLYDAVDD